MLKVVTDPGQSLRIALMIESDGPGGAEMMVFRLAEELRRRGHIVTPVGPRNGTGWMGEMLRAAGFSEETYWLKRPIDPGTHHFEARRGETVVAQDLTLQEGESASVTLQLPPEVVKEPPPKVTAPVRPAPRVVPPSTRIATNGDDNAARRAVGWIGVGAGVLGISVGVTTWILALDKGADLEATCPDRTCDPTPENMDTLDAYESFRTATVVSLIAGGVALGAGIVILVTAPSRNAPRARAIEPWIGAGSMGIRGAF